MTGPPEACLGAAMGNGAGAGVVMVSSVLALGRLPLRRHGHQGRVGTHARTFNAGIILVPLGCLAMAVPKNSHRVIRYETCTVGLLFIGHPERFIDVSTREQF